MNRQAQSAVLFLLGASLLHAGTTDLYLRYVKQGLRPLVLAAGAVLIAAAVATVWYEWKRARRQKGHEAEGEGHEAEAGHTHHEPRVAWLLVLPLLALILVAPPALGSYSATRTGTALQEPLAYPALPAADPLPLSVVDYAGRAVYDHGRTLQGRRVQLTGFLALDRDGTPYLVRMALNCCAADAQPVKVALTGQVPPVLQPDTWLQVTGSYTARRAKDPVNGGPIPYIEVTEAKPAPAPKDPYDESWNS
ncbi:TIGR03943 family protein [Streptomyces sp. cf386]|uniref:TIGR03943 family putative permease subunit n=1 Tax=Streptomyces sp. cf386 TaxID=1761904 RepID=UPI00088BDFD6|nr:TIGR03943 family protein [Streptomyces sp. cf386]SDO54064.1 TIGR03943 family protein [Streptomyces sp. cf386]